MVNEFVYKNHKITGCLENSIVKNVIDERYSSNTNHKMIYLILKLNMYILNNPLFYENTLIIHSTNVSNNKDLHNEIKDYSREHFGYFMYFYDIPEEELFYLVLKYNIKKSFFKAAHDIKIEKIELS